MKGDTCGKFFYTYRILVESLTKIMHECPKANNVHKYFEPIFICCRLIYYYINGKLQMKCKTKTINVLTC